MKSALAALGLALMLASAGPAQAGAVYSYLGKPYDTIIDLSFPAGSFDTSMRVSGSIELAQPLAPNLAFTDIGADILDFTFSNGRSTLAKSDADLTTFFFVQTDAAGQIVAWNFIVQQSPPLTLANDPEITISTQNDPAGLLVGIPFVEDRGGFSRCDPATVPRGLCTTQSDLASVAATGAWTLVGTPVPAPSSAALAVLALVALARRARRATTMPGGAQRAREASAGPDGLRTAGSCAA